MARKIVVFVALALALPAAAGEVYRWRDAAGVIHFTDDPSRIPPDAQPVRAHPERLIVLENPAEKAAEGEDGEALFAARCAKCHVLFPEEDASKEPLVDALLDEKTHAPRPLEEVVKKLRMAADGRFSDMDALEISDEELRRIARFLLAQVR